MAGMWHKIRAKMATMFFFFSVWTDTQSRIAGEVIQHHGWVDVSANISLWLPKLWDKLRIFFVLLLKLLSSVILAMEIVWFIGFWSWDMFIVINLLSTMKKHKGFFGGCHEKISIGF
jgi:hypothetical protein